MKLVLILISFLSIEMTAQARFVENEFFLKEKFGQIGTKLEMSRGDEKLGTVEVGPLTGTLFLNRFSDREALLAETENYIESNGLSSKKLVFYENNILLGRLEEVKRRQVTGDFLPAEEDFRLRSASSELIAIGFRNDTEGTRITFLNPINREKLLSLERPFSKWTEEGDEWRIRSFKKAVIDERFMAILAAYITRTESSEKMWNHYRYAAQQLLGPVTTLSGVILFYLFRIKAQTAAFRTEVLEEKWNERIQLDQSNKAAFQEKVKQIKDAILAEKEEEKESLKTQVNRQTENKNALSVDADAARARRDELIAEQVANEHRIAELRRRIIELEEGNRIRRRGVDAQLGEVIPSLRVEIEEAENLLRQAEAALHEFERLSSEKRAQENAYRAELEQLRRLSDQRLSEEKEELVAQTHQQNEELKELNWQEKEARALQAQLLAEQEANENQIVELTRRITELREGNRTRRIRVDGEATQIAPLQTQVHDAKSNLAKTQAAQNEFEQSYFERREKEKAKKQQEEIEQIQLLSRKVLAESRDLEEIIVQIGHQRDEIGSQEHLLGLLQQEQEKLKGDLVTKEATHQGIRKERLSAARSKEEQFTTELFDLRIRLGEVAEQEQEVRRELEALLQRQREDGDLEGEIELQRRELVEKEQSEAQKQLALEAKRRELDHEYQTLVEHHELNKSKLRDLFLEEKKEDD